MTVCTTATVTSEVVHFVVVTVLHVCISQFSWYASRLKDSQSTTYECCFDWAYRGRRVPSKSDDLVGTYDEVAQK